MHCSAVSDASINRRIKIISPDLMQKQATNVSLIIQQYQQSSERSIGLLEIDAATYIYKKTQLSLTSQASLVFSKFAKQNPKCEEHESCAFWSWTNKSRYLDLYRLSQKLITAVEMKAIHRCIRSRDLEQWLSAAVYYSIRQCCM